MVISNAPTCHLYTLQPSLRITNELVELGIDPTSSDPIAVIILNKIDGMRYEGDVGTCIFIDYLDATFGKNSRVSVLDVGSGFGGPSRLLALKRPNTHLVALEFVPEISTLAQELTQRCPEVKDRVKHVTGDAAQLSDSVLGTSQQQFHAAQSVLALLHIPDLRTALSRIYERLEVGGFLYIEDFWVHDSLTSVEQSHLMERVGCPRMPLLQTEWCDCLRQVGFQQVDFQDVTSSWQPWIHGRAQEYSNNIERHERVQGPQCSQLVLEFYQTMDSLFSRGLKGCRIVAFKSK